MRMAELACFNESQSRETLMNSRSKLTGYQNISNENLSRRRHPRMF